MGNAGIESTEPSLTVALEGVSIKYEHSWLHRHCTSTLVHHQRARGSGRLFSGLMALNVVFLGAALVSSVILTSMPAQNSQIYLSILMFFSSAWALYYLLRTRKKSGVAVLQDHHAGALWLRASLILFGIFSLLLAVFKIGYDVTLLECKLPMELLFSVMEIIFISTQTCLLWLSCRDCIQVQHNLSRCGIMLTLATNLLLWLLAVINDSVHREMQGLVPNSTTVESSKCLCQSLSICRTFQRGYVILYPFNLEYSLICASMLYIMWRNVGRKDVLPSDFSHPSFRLQEVLYGPILGAAALLMGISIFILYQVQASAGTATTSSFILYYGFSDTILPIMVISCFIGIIAQTFREKRLDITEHDSEHNEDSEGKVRENSQEVKKECRHRNVEMCKTHGHLERDIGEHTETKGEEDNWQAQEDIEKHSGRHGGNDWDNGSQVENGKYNEHITMQELEKEEQKEHLEPNHHTRTTKRKVSMEKNCHRDHKYISQSCAPKNYTRSLEIILLLGAALGQFTISYYSIVAIVATGSWNVLNSINLAYSILMILQHVFQNIFIIEGMTKEHKGHVCTAPNMESKEEPDEAPRRMSMLEIRRVSLAYLQSFGHLSMSRRLVKEIALFLVFCNIMLWAMSAFGEHPQYTNGLEREFYGSSAWFSIINFGLPLTVFYRMHSVGGLLEVYVTA
ncbi:proton channel OTOP3 [Pseudophryne corroboree]|uniref:proton channel OTOP3 n=1 Tax=Pseudophryne corroboree TaxID=495146 RepID=UPI0030821895